MTDENTYKPEEMSAFFDARAEGYDTHMEFGTEELDRYFSIMASAFLPTNEAVRVLDLGCGTGEELRWIFPKTPNARITGIDMSPGMLSLLQEKYPDKAHQIELRVGSYTELELGCGEYDYAVSSFTIHHLLHDAKRELYRRILKSLKPGGLYVEGDYIIATQEEEPSIFDELDRLIDSKATLMFYHVFMGGFFLSMASLALKMSPTTMFTMLCATLVIAGSILDLAQLYFYRRGV